MFRYLFRCKEHREKAKGRFVQCGAVTFTRRRRVEFPITHFPKKVLDWQQSFFYYKSTAPEGQFDFLPFSEARFEPSAKFARARTSITNEELESIKPLIAQLKVLMKRGLRSCNLIASWIMLQVSPLSDRRLLMYEYTGTVDDPGRWGEAPMNLSNLQWWMSLCVTDIVHDLDVGGLSPFCNNVEVPQVSSPAELI